MKEKEVFLICNCKPSKCQVPKQMPMFHNKLKYQRTEYLNIKKTHIIYMNCQERLQIYTSILEKPQALLSLKNKNKKPCHSWSKSGELIKSIHTKYLASCTSYSPSIIFCLFVLFLICWFFFLPYFHHSSQKVA